MGALRAVRLMSTAQKEYGTRGQVLFLESLLSSSWMAELERKKVEYLRCRVREIQSLTDIEHWRDCTTYQNPAAF